MPKSLRKHLISVISIFFSNSAVRAHVSHAYRKIEMTKDRISLILGLSAMFLSFHMVLSFVNAPIVLAFLDSISCLDPSSVTTEAKYLKLWNLSIQNKTWHISPTKLEEEEEEEGGGGGGGGGGGEQ